MKSKLNAVLNHPAAGLITIVAINTAIVVASVVVTRKLEKKEALEV